MCVHTSPRKYSPKCSKYFFSQCKRFCSIELTIRSYKWWAWVDLNYRPHAYQACALTRLSYRPAIPIRYNLILRKRNDDGEHPAILPIEIGILFQEFKNIYKNILKYSLERRWSSRRFPYGYLVTTSPQSLILPWPAASLRLAHSLQVKPIPMVWRAVCTRPGNVFTASCCYAITSDSDFMRSSFRPQSELRQLLGINPLSLPL